MTRSRRRREGGGGSEQDVDYNQSDFLFPFSRGSRFRYTVCLFVCLYEYVCGSEVLVDACLLLRFFFFCLSLVIQSLHFHHPVASDENHMKS